MDVYFGPKAPAGMENNWVQTIPERDGSDFGAFTVPGTLVQPDLAARRD